MKLQFVDKIGVEIEGGFKLGRTLPEDHGIDGSIRSSLPNIQMLEIRSKPETLENLRDFIFSHYPDYSNYTCGMHTHVSLKDSEDYLRLLDEEFFSFFKERMRVWGRLQKIGASHLFWKRLNNQTLGKRRGKPRTNFCKTDLTKDNAILQLTGSGDRYCFLNFAHYKYGTVECRLFPVFKDRPEIAYSAVCEVVRTIEWWLKQKQGKHGKSHGHKIVREVSVD